MKKFLTTSEAAEICGVVHTTVIRWIGEGKLRAHETPGGHRRIDREGLAGFMKRFKIPVPASLADSRFKILAVDDETKMLSVIRKMFSKYSREVELHTTASGMEALVMLGRSRFDLIILDVIMPDMDGIQVCRTLKQNPDTAGIKIVAITGKQLSDEQEDYLKKNAERILRKPFSPSALMEAVRALMSLTRK